MEKGKAEGPSRAGRKVEKKGSWHPAHSVAKQDTQIQTRLGQAPNKVVKESPPKGDARTRGGRTTLGHNGQGHGQRLWPAPKIPSNRTLLGAPGLTTRSNVRY